MENIEIIEQLHHLRESIRQIGLTSGAMEHHAHLRQGYLIPAHRLLYGAIQYLKEGDQNTVGSKSLPVFHHLDESLGAAIAALERDAADVCGFLERNGLKAEELTYEKWGRVPSEPYLTTVNKSLRILSSMKYSLGVDIINEMLPFTRILKGRGAENGQG